MYLHEIQNSTFEKLKSLGWEPNGHNDPYMPSQAEVAAWLRVQKSIFITMEPRTRWMDTNTNTIRPVLEWSATVSLINTFSVVPLFNDSIYGDTYEGTLEEAITKTLTFLSNGDSND